MSLVFKKWDTTDPYNWYPVYLLNCTYTTIAHIIADRMNPHVCNNELEAQYGCLQEKGCTNAFFPLKIALQLRKERDLESFVVFVNLIKAFDTVNYELMFLFFLIQLPIKNGQNDKTYV